MTRILCVALRTVLVLGVLLASSAWFPSQDLAQEPVVGGGTVGHEEDDCGALLYIYDGSPVVKEHGLKSHVKIYRYERCVKVVYLNDLDTDVDDYGFVLPMDYPPPPPAPPPPPPPQGGPDIRAFDKTLTGEIIGTTDEGDPIAWYGELKCITVAGCTDDLIFIQNVKITQTTTEPGKDPKSHTSGWGRDGPLPKPGEGLLDPGAADTGLTLDIAGSGSTSSTPPATDHPNGTIIEDKREYETWVFCNFIFVKYVYWGFTLTTTVVDGTLPPPTVTPLPGTPSAHGSGDSPNYEATSKQVARIRNRTK